MCICVCLSACLPACLPACMYVCMYVCMDYVYTCVYTYIYIDIHTYIHTYSFMALGRNMGLEIPEFAGLLLSASSRRPGPTRGNSPSANAYWPVGAL